MEPERKIIHIDMDAFYASVEQRDNPELRGKPVIVGGRPESRGVVAAASYESRKYGIRSAMSSTRALELCPQAVFVRPNISKYRRISNSIFGILREYSELVEPLSLDEAFVDVSRNKKRLRYAREVAQEMRATIYEFTGLTASCGLSDCKFLAKIASDLNKPNGMAIIPPHRKLDFLTTLPVRKIPGVGRVTEERMLNLGINTVGKLRKFPLEELKRIFGKSGLWYYQLARGIDNRPVQPHRERKSIGSENTFQSDTKSKDFLIREIESHAHRVAQALARKELFARTVTVKVKFSDFSQVTRSRTTEHLVSGDEVIRQTSLALLAQTDAFIRPVRLLGVSVSGLERPIADPQLGLFDKRCI